jgi:alkylation response protein AidB-like acyl-CoA dehydrogenase
MTDVTQAAYVVPEEPTPDMEPVADFRARARAWLADHMPPECDGWGQRIQPGRWDVERTLQRKLWEGGFAGICFPAEYGGLGLSRAHQRAFTEESFPYDMPYGFNVPTLGILAATLLDYGTHEQKAEHLPKILSGEALWVQFLSEPSGGSDLAGCLTRADRDGDVWILNGSKIWSSASEGSGQVSVVSAMRGSFRRRSPRRRARGGRRASRRGRGRAWPDAGTGGCRAPR